MVARMLEHNIASVRYRDYHIFAGAYPNDDQTQKAVRGACERFSNVHLALCPHDGPTSKADCLNWIYQHVGLWEEQYGRRFETIVTHDAEDVIHPDELLWINYYTARFDFIQTPVLALATPLLDVTHGVYCDEFRGKSYAGHGGAPDARGICAGRGGGHGVSQRRSGSPGGS